jgi:hypothetical protein
MSRVAIRQNLEPGHVFMTQGFSDHNTLIASYLPHPRFASLNFPLSADAEGVRG